MELVRVIECVPVRRMAGDSIKVHSISKYIFGVWLAFQVLYTPRIILYYMLVHDKSSCIDNI